MGIQKVVLLGSGNLANHFGKYFIKNKINVTQVISRNKHTVTALSRKLKTLCDTSIEMIDRKADAYFLCVNDDSIKQLSVDLSGFLSSDKLLIHCSGSRSLEEIDDYFENRAVIWPLQSFGILSKLDWIRIPFFVESSHGATNAIEEFCKKLKWKYYPVDYVRRKRIHLAAVIANNFTNFNLIVADKILHSIDIPLEVLKPILNEGIENAFLNGPEQSQTGPAKRSDQKVIQFQLKELSGIMPEFKEIYKLYSQKIQDHYNRNSNLG